MDQRDADGQDDDGENGRGCGRPFKGGTPAAGHAGRHHNREGLDRFHGAGPEDGQNEHNRRRCAHAGIPSTTSSMSTDGNPTTSSA